VRSLSRKEVSIGCRGVRRRMEKKASGRDMLEGVSWLMGRREDVIEVGLMKCRVES